MAHVQLDCTIEVWKIYDCTRLLAVTTYDVTTPINRHAIRYSLIIHVLKTLGVPGGPRTRISSISLYLQHKVEK